MFTILCVLLLAVSGCKDDTASGTNTDAKQAEQTDANDEDNPQVVTDLSHLWPPVRVQPSNFDFGDVLINQPITKNVELVNHGDVDVRLVRSSSNCGCTTAEVAGLVVPANGTLQLPVHFDAQGKIGRRSATVTLFFDGWERPIMFKISAFVVQ